MYNPARNILGKTLNAYCGIFNAQLVRFSTAFPLFKVQKRFREPNPGLENRLNLLKDNTTYRLDLDIDSVESDFMKVGAMYDSHKSEMAATKEEKQLKVVKQKYFKTSIQPNFLTWAEKEQIRYLHSSDPDEWSAEKLAHSFPASETVIKKVIKSRWKPDDSHKIIKHDESVSKNWNALISGKLEFNSNEKAHLLKFSKRKQIVHPHVEEQEPTKSLLPMSTGEFSQIIVESHTNSSEQKQPLQLANTSTPCVGRKPYPTNNKVQHIQDTYVLDALQPNVNSDKHFTLDKYREITKHADVNRDGLQLPIVGGENREKLSKSNSSTLNKYARPVAEVSKNLNTYPETICIPKNKWKEGGTFKVGECYYDDDGEFLYRVPGMK